ncbi:UNVERIFIED_CONTAM: hypothetical protein Slati_3848800, partial [Sesamum latifolium]
GMEFRMIEGDRFLLKFFHNLDRQRVMSSCPWAYEKSLLVLAHVDLSENPSLIDLDLREFNIHIHGLPVGKITTDVASWIGNKIGRLIETDIDNNDNVWGSSIRIWVAIDVTKPLRRRPKNSYSSQ